MQTWKVTAKFRDTQTGRVGKFVGKVGAHSEAGARQAVAEMFQREGWQAIAPAKLR